MTSEVREFLEGLVRRLNAIEDPDALVPDPSPPVEHRRICVGMATYDDPAGVWFTLQSIRLYHPEMADALSFVVVDNHPEGTAAEHLKQLDRWIPTLRYVPFREYRGTAVRDRVFREAEADIVCCVDSHVLLAPGALAAIDRYFADNPESRDLVQGPLLDDTLSPTATHFTPDWGAGMYGRWALDSRLESADGRPFEIEMQGLGVFACRRDAWPGFNPRFRGFGGEEGYIHEKVRRAGGRVLCHPGVRWTHLFARPSGVPYNPQRLDVLRNYLIGWDELGWDTSPVEEHYRALFDEAGLGADYPEFLSMAKAEARG
jgi:hypothetical protein